MKEFFIFAQSALFVWAGWRMSDRDIPSVITAAIFGAFAYHMCRDRGIEAWSDWTSGDAYDVAAMTFMVVCYCRGRA